ncbi:hypothetical protein NDU88_005002 [Pleurodeles waltl]|uniref:RNase H type-1 domain-containing protein n=1 Tax=Pleurodeles waltl TaxID=8319 RepID=A0AAV7NNY6_PLEWA|nr:hypothetical protein NDU88_005002 [Pleurodeles waltl]
MACSHTPSEKLQVIMQLTLFPHISAQVAELTALIEALTQSTGETVTVYSDSAYVITTVHSSISRWRRRGFLKSDGTPAAHRDLLELLINTLTLPKCFALVKCAAHIGGKDSVSQGNVLAGQVVQKSAYGAIEEAWVRSVQRILESEPSPDKPYTETASLFLSELQETTLHEQRE